MTALSTRASRWIALASWLLAAVALVELGITAYVALIAGFRLDLGPVVVTASDPWKPFIVGVVCGSLALWLFDQRTAALTRTRIRFGPAMAAVLLAAALSPLWTPILAREGFPFGHDVSGHATYTYLFDRALRQGQFPVRWVEWVEPGLGQPLFNFYQVGLYYLVEGVHLLVPSLTLSLKATVVLFWACGAVFMFLLFRRHGWSSGIIAAIVFAWSPYLMLDGYVRAAYPELVAIGLAPGVLWTLDRFARTGQWASLCAFALLSAVLTVCHPPTALITGPVWAMYSLYLLAQGRTTLRRLLWLVPASALAFGMTAFFTWPALLEMDSINFSGMTATMGLDYHDHFVYPRQWLDSPWWYGTSVPGPNDQLFLRLGRVQMSIVAAALVTVGAAAVTRRVTARTADLVWWLGVAVLALFMTTGASLPVWEAFPPLAFVLFPWRFMMLTGIACAAMGAILISMQRRNATSVLIILCVVAVQWYLARDYRRLVHAVPEIEMNIDDPRWSETLNARRTAYYERGYDPASGKETPRAAAGRWRIVAGNGSVREQTMSDHALAFVAESDAAMRLMIHTRYVEGWVATLDGRRAPMAVEPQYGYMLLGLPAGRHQVDVRFSDTALRRSANVVTGASGIAWLAWVAILAGGAAARRLRRGPVTDWTRAIPLRRARR